MTVTLTILATIALTAAVFLAWRLKGAKKQLEDSQKNAEVALHDLRESLVAERDLLLNALNDSFLLVDREGVVLFANEPTTALLNGRKALNRSIKEVLLDDRLTDPIVRCLRTRESVCEEVVLPRQASFLSQEAHQGETAWKIDAEPIEWTPQIALTRVIIRDVTSEHHIEQVRKDFVANASHELRTPLAIINGYLENLLDDQLLEEPEVSRKFLGIMQKHAIRISRIIEDMLMISRLESGEATHVSKKPFSFDECVRDVIERLEAVISNQRAQVRIECATPGMQVQGDRFYWTQVFFNLIENALKQNTDRSVSIRVGGRREPDGTLHMWVSDDGVGIPSSDIPFIFRRFYRVEKHHSQNEIKGTGLGLSIVKRAVEAHGGSIDVSSTPGRETRFTMSLPPM